jgi:hypothetical protein
VDLLKAEQDTVEKVDKQLIKKRKRNTEDQLEKYGPEKPFKIGDLVRINLQIYPSVRKDIMLKGKKSFVQRWSSETYKITKILKPHVPGRIVEYQVTGLKYKFKPNLLLRIKKPEKTLKALKL